MNQFQVQMMKHMHNSKKLGLKNPYDSNCSQPEERKRSNTQTSCNSTSTNPFTQLESSTHYDQKTVVLPEIDYIPEMSRESSAVKKRHTVELDPSKIQQLITPARVNYLIVENDTTNQRSLSTDYSSVKKNGIGEKKISESMAQLRERLFQHSASQEGVKSSIKTNENGQVVEKLMRLEGFYNFPCLYDKEEIESRRRSREYSDIVQERHELWRNRSHSANQQKFVQSIIENGKKDYKRAKRIYSTSQSRLRFQSDKEQFSKDVFVKVYDDCKRKCKDFDSLIRSSTSLTKSSTMQGSIIHPTFPAHVKQTNVQLKQLNKEFLNNYSTSMNKINLNQSQQRLEINNKFQEMEESMRFSKQSEQQGYSPFIYNTHQKILNDSNCKQDSIVYSQQSQQGVNVSQFQGNNIQNDQTQDSIGRQRVSSQTKLQNSLNLNINSPNLLNSDYFDILNSYSTKSQQPCQGFMGGKTLQYSADQYLNQCNSLVKLESDLKKYREVQQNQIQQFIQQPQQLQNQKQQSKKVSRKEYLASKCRHNITTMYCSICNRQVKSKI